MKARYEVINGEVIAEKRGGVRRTLVPDPLGSTVALLDNTLAQSDTWTYWPYGEVRTRTGTTGTPFQFVGLLGYYRDSAMRTYVRARYLNSATARWLTKDPSQLRAENEIHAYAYVTNDPLGRTDPSGLLYAPQCPDGYEDNFVTCYGTGGVGYGDISSHHKNCNNPPGHHRRPRLGDCAVDQSDPTCEFGQKIIIRNFKSKQHPEGQLVWTCTTCDSGQGNQGVDIFIPFPDKQCSVNLQNYTKAWHGSGRYCVKCV